LFYRYFAKQLFPNRIAGYYPIFFNLSKEDAEYKDNRKEFRPSRSLKAKVVVSDSRTARGLAGVRILFSLAEEPKLDKKSAAAGGLNVKSLDEGRSKVGFSKIGYTSQHLMVHILKSECTRISVALQKEEERGCEMAIMIGYPKGINTPNRINIINLICKTKYKKALSIHLERLLVYAYHYCLKLTKKHEYW